MENAPALAAAADSSDPRTGLRAVAALRRLLEQLEALQVDNAREKGWSWQEIAEALGVSRQAVHKKHAGRIRQVRGGPAAPLRVRLTRGGTRNA
jgi:DNA-directed RNA polymerase specialized sigma24 family protein